MSKLGVRDPWKFRVRRMRRHAQPRLRAAQLARGLRPGPRRGEQGLGDDPRARLREPRRVVAIDTNVLIFFSAPSQNSTSGTRPLIDLLGGVPESGVPWAIPWPCIHEFLAIVTHPRIYDPAHSAWRRTGAGRLLDGGADRGAPGRGHRLLAGAVGRRWTSAVWPGPAFTMRGSSRFAGSTA